MSEKFESDCRFVGEFDDSAAVFNSSTKIDNLPSEADKEIVEIISKEFSMSRLRAEQIVARVFSLTKDQTKASA